MATGNSINNALPQLTINATTTVDGIINDSTMATASATKLATSSSIKTYVDNSVASTNVTNNLIIGGDFGVNPWQRGTTFTGAGPAVYTADRFLYGTGSTTAVVDVLKTADAPTATEAGVYTSSCLHVDVTTADAAPGAGAFSYIRYDVEGYDIAKAGFGQSGTRYVTLSFWHKHTVTGTYCVNFQNSATNRSYVVEYTQTITNTWEYETITIPVDTTGTWLYTNGSGLTINFAIFVGSTFQTTPNSWQAGDFFVTSNQVNGLSSTSNNFKLALVQLEMGQFASQFQEENIEQVLAKCQRYYFKTFAQGTTPAQNAGTTGCFEFPAIQASTGVQRSATYTFPVSMRTTPATATLYNPSAANAEIFNVDRSESCSSSTASGLDYNGVSFTAVGSASGQVSDRLIIHFTAESELH